MATGAWPTIADVTSRMDAAGEQHVIAEMLSQSVAVVKDMPMREASEMFGHEFAFRTSIPAGYWRQINMGVPYSKSTTGKARVGMGTLEDYSQVDRLLAEGSGNAERFRESEDVAFLEGMGQTIEQTTWYGNSRATPAEFTGFSAFYNTLNTGVQNSQNVIDADGVGSSNASIWLVCWGMRTWYGIYPRSSKAGLSMEDKGDTTPAYDSFGNRFEAFTSWFRQIIGLVPHDWRFAGRICNIDVTTAGLAGPSAYDIFVGLAQLAMLPPTLTQEGSGVTQTDAPDEASPGIRPVLYTNRTVRHWMDVQGMRDRNVLLTVNDAAGKVQDVFRGIKVMISDQLLINEARVTT